MSAIFTLSKREQDILEFIKNHLSQHGEAPLLSQIAAGVGIKSKGVIHRYLKSLEAAGAIERDGRHRGIRLCNGLPYLGKIAAGLPIEAINMGEQIDLLPIVQQRDCFVLKVAGDSMRDAGILDGDLVIIKSADTAKSGDIVVALIDDFDVTLKTIKYQQDKILLIPANDNYKVGEYTAARVKIQGILSAQLRVY